MPAGALLWDDMASRFYETGVSNGVLYSQVAGVYNDGVAWNGLTGVTVNPTGGASNKQYADNIAYLNLISVEQFEGTIDCFTAPDGFLTADGVTKTAYGVQVTQQSRPIFGFSWKSNKGNALNDSLGFILHLAYGLQAAPSQKQYQTVNDTPAPTAFSWTVTSTPVTVTGMKPTAYIKIDSTDPTVNQANLASLMTILYGAPGVAPRLPLPDEVNSIMGTGILTATPIALAYVSGTHTITYAAQTGVTYWREDTGVQVTASIVLTVGQSLVIQARPATGYTFTGTFVNRWFYTY